MSNPRNGKHDATIDALILRLEQYGYTDIKRNIEYRVGPWVGELDVVTTKDGFHHYYEVKSSYNKKSRHKAEWQAYKLSKAYPNGNWKYILVTPKRVERIYPVPHRKYHQKHPTYRRNRNTR